MVEKWLKSGMLAVVTSSLLMPSYLGFAQELTTSYCGSLDWLAKRGES